MNLQEVGVDEGAFMEAMLQELAWLGVSVKKFPPPVVERKGSGFRV